ncbi:MAG: M23 family metallopeptidase [Bacteroidetes bacterium]|nr:MAG: M23 family metallopeptidase [Bacteroidota bacterium]
MISFKDLSDKLKEKIKISASDPVNFRVLWSFNATRTQFYSALLVLILAIGSLSALFVLKGPFSYYFKKDDVSIERSKLQEQYKEIEELKAKIDAQEKYMRSLFTILEGKVPEDSLSEDVPETANLDTKTLVTEPTENEKELSGKVKDDLRTNNSKKKSTNIPFFSSPVKGVISQDFDLVNHIGIDVITPKDKTVIACLSGTVIFASYTQKDGYVIIIEHSNGYLSVYKHNKALLKKVGSKVFMNDPIAIVGNTGENSTGPHLHFELWYQQHPVDPKDYMKFN